jgi:arylsulfatase A-like enzyme/Flp pilus assembly protein TadD
MKRWWIVVALLFASCHREQAVRFENASVILISIDTLRSDHLPAYGYKGVDTPNIDAFRRDSILYRNAYSHCPMTLPSHVSMLTGLLPTQHGVRDNQGFHFDGAKHPTVPALLRARGYATGAAVSSVVLAAENGLATSFDDYDSAIDTHAGSAFAEYQRPGNITEERAEKWIDAHAAKPFFYFFHIYEPHVPYDPPEPFRSRYANAYDGEIATADAIVGKLLEFLKSKGIYDRAIIVLASDHGEGLDEHGEDQHSILVYREALQVPLLLKLPRSKFAGSSATAPAALIDITPTILTLLGVDVPKESSQLSLLSLLGQSAPRRRVYAESLYPRYHFGWSELRSLIDGEWHYIDSPRPELYDVAHDTGEKQDVITAQRRIAASMKSDLAKYGDAVPTIDAVDPETASKLAALGYIGSARNRPAGPLPNPRDEISELKNFRAALHMKPADQIDALRAIVARKPEMVEAWTELARTLASVGRREEAIDAYKQALGRSPLDSDIALSLGEVELDAGRTDEAAKLAEASMTQSPRRARALLVHVAIVRKDLANARMIANVDAQSMYVEPSDILLLAEVAIAEGNYPVALEAVDRAARLAAEQEVSRVWRLEFLRADALARMGRIDDAKQAYRREIELFPNDARAYGNLAVVEVLTNDRHANETLDALSRIDPALAAKTRAMFRSGSPR